MHAEHRRLEETRSKTAPWRKWGPYLSERQWGTVREDYSDSGNAWDYFSHDQARSRAYRWGEDGLAGISDDRQLLCFALAYPVAHDPDEPQERDPRERHEVERQGDQASAARVREPRSGIARIGRRPDPHENQRRREQEREQDAGDGRCPGASAASGPLPHRAPSPPLRNTLDTGALARHALPTSRSVST